MSPTDLDHNINSVIYFEDNIFREISFHIRINIEKFLF